MEIREDVLNKLISEINLPLLSSRRVASDLKYEYILDGISLNMITVIVQGTERRLEIYNSSLARIFAYDFISNTDTCNQPEAFYIHFQRQQYIEEFDRADENGYNDLIEKVEKRIRPYQNTDERVTQTIWKIIQESISIKKDRIIELSLDSMYNEGYKNGLIRRAIEIICENPNMFLIYPNLLIKQKAIDHTKHYYFNDIFWSRAAYNEALEMLSPEYLSEDGQTWSYRQKGNKTVFIALFEELYVKDYLKKRLTNQEIKNIGLNSFNIDISERTFNENTTIIKAQSVFKFMPIHKRSIKGDSSALEC